MSFRPSGLRRKLLFDLCDKVSGDRSVVPEPSRCEASGLTGFLIVGLLIKHEGLIAQSVHEDRVTDIVLRSQIKLYTAIHDCIIPAIADNSKGPTPRGHSPTTGRHPHGVPSVPWRQRG